VLFELAVYSCCTVGGQDVFVGIENKWSDKKDSTPLSVADITTKWELFSGIVEKIKPGAHRLLVFIAARDCQDQVNEYLDRMDTAAARDVEKQLEAAGCRHRILVIDDANLRDYFGATCHSIFFPYHFAMSFSHDLRKVIEGVKERSVNGAAAVNQLWEFWKKCTKDNIRLLISPFSSAERKEVSSLLLK